MDGFWKAWRIIIVECFKLILTSCYSQLGLITQFSDEMEGHKLLSTEFLKSFDENTFWNNWTNYIEWVLVGNKQRLFIMNMVSFGKMRFYLA